MSITPIRVLFFLAAAYDGVLASLALLFGPSLLQFFEVTPPNHWGYIQFPALLLLVFAAMFVQVGREPRRYAHLIPYGMGLKAAYCGVVFGHQAMGSIPAPWLPWAWADLGFLALFLLAYRSLRGGAAA
jgi:hypothetical protein